MSFKNYDNNKRIQIKQNKKGIFIYLIGAKNIETYSVSISQ